MPAPLERDRQYSDKFLDEEFFLVVDFSERLPAGITIAPRNTGHTVTFFRVSDGVDVTTTLCDVSTLGPDPTNTALQVNMLPTAVGTEGLYRGVFKAKTTAAVQDFEVMETWVRIRSQ